MKKEDADLTPAAWYLPVDHTADRALLIAAPDLAGLLVIAAEGMFSLITDLAAVGTGESHSIQVAADTPEELLVKTLNELLFIFDTRHFLCRRLLLTHLHEYSLSAQATGETFDPARHKILAIVKAATYHSLAIKNHTGRLETRIVFDT